jgi:SAM-dependent methyltransferase
MFLCWAWIAALSMLVATDRVTHTPAAANNMPPQQDLFAESDAYERFMGRWSRRLAPLLVKFASVDEGDSVLDVGSGTGALAFALAEAIPSVRVTGVDPSSAYVRYAQAQTPGDRVRFSVGDAQALEIPDASVDKTLSLLVMNFIPDSGKALREMIRVTRPGGVVAAAVWDYGEGWRCFGCFGMKPSPSIQRLPHAMNGTCRCAGKGSWQPCGGPMDFSASRNCQPPSSSPSRHSTTTGAPFLMARARQVRTRRDCPNHGVPRSIPGSVAGCWAHARTGHIQASRATQ